MLSMNKWCFLINFLPINTFDIMNSRWPANVQGCMPGSKCQPNAAKPVLLPAYKEQSLAKIDIKSNRIKFSIPPTERWHENFIIRTHLFVVMGVVGTSQTWIFLFKKCINYLFCEHSWLCAYNWNTQKTLPVLKPIFWMQKVPYCSMKVLNYIILFQLINIIIPLTRSYSVFVF